MNNYTSVYPPCWINIHVCVKIRAVLLRVGKTGFGEKFLGF